MEGQSCFLLALFGILGYCWGLVFLNQKQCGVVFLLWTNSKKKGWRIPNRCYMCKEVVTSNNILLHCSKAAILGQLIYMPLLVFKGWCILWWEVRFWDGMGLLSKRKKKAWKAASLCLVWTLWRKWNRRAFENIEDFVEWLGFEPLSKAWLLFFAFPSPCFLAFLVSLYISWLLLCASLGVVNTIDILPKEKKNCNLGSWFFLFWECYVGIQLMQRQFEMQLF